jgi:hypothetical protein
MRRAHGPRGGARGVRAAHDDGASFLDAACLSLLVSIIGNGSKKTEPKSLVYDILANRSAFYFLETEVLENRINRTEPNRWLKPNT